MSEPSEKKNSARPANLAVARFMGYRNVLELDDHNDNNKPNTHHHHHNHPNKQSHHNP